MPSGSRNLAFAACALLFVTGCSDSTLNSPPCVGDACDDVEAVDVPDIEDELGGDGGDVGVDSYEDYRSGDVGTDAPDCLGGRNACGGCNELLAEPGTACSDCEDGEWVCVGFETVGCQGGTASLREYWIDLDRDGYGQEGTTSIEACGPPTARWVENDDDCDDSRNTVNPGAREQCNGRDDTCEGDVDEAPEGCDDACCNAAFVCEEERCLIRCDGTRCGSELNLCCTGDDLCYGDACITPDDECEFTEHCDIGSFCDPTLGLCIPRAAVPECVYVPEPGEFEPRLGCRWTSAGLPNPGRDDVVATPVVINLTDDNGDGAVDQQDIPEIAFLTYDLDESCCNEEATLRVVNGQCNDDGTMNTLASISTPLMTNDTGIAAGDIIGDDGVPEIVVVGFYGSSNTRPQGTIAFQRDSEDGTEWSVGWTNPGFPTWAVHTRGGAAISIANVDGEGGPEVVIGNVVLNGQTGALVWDGIAQNPGLTVGIGNNAFLGPSSAIADVDLDGDLEIIAGNTLYDHEGAALWTYDYTSNNSICGGSLPCDGFSGIANFDDDDFGEIAIIRLGQVFILEHTGEEIWRTNIPTLASDPCEENESGPPTIADFDGDGRPEVGTAAADFYVVADMDCDPDEGDVPEECASRGILWRTRNRDCSSRVTASSVFDFEGDGAAEVVYADEQNFRIFDGRTGTILFDDDTHGSHTRLEMPVIADVDNDGNAEVVIPENGQNDGRGGIDIWEDVSDNWVRTRRIWNQHGYSITNVTEGGRIPEYPEPNWMLPRLNNFRQNVQPDGLFDAPDLALEDLEVEANNCITDVRFRLRNAGALGVPPGIIVRVSIDDAVSGESWGETVETTLRLVPGGAEAFSLSFGGPPELEAERPVTVTVAIDPDAEVSECREDNNVEVAESRYGCDTK